MKTDLSKADEVTADIFINIYMRHWTQIYESLGQTPEVIAEVQNTVKTPMVLAMVHTQMCSLSLTIIRLIKLCRTDQNPTQQNEKCIIIITFIIINYSYILFIPIMLYWEGEGTFQFVISVRYLPHYLTWLQGILNRKLNVT